MEEVIKLKYKPRKKFRPYQKKTLKKVLKLTKKGGGAGIFFEPGLGKSKVAIDFCCIKYLQGKLKFVVIGVPYISTLGVWDIQLREHVPKHIPYKLCLVSGGKTTLLDNFYDYDYEGIHFVVITYASLSRAYLKISKLGIDCLVADELHFLKHYTQRTRAMYFLSNRAKWRLGLTGTPTAKTPLDIFYQYKLLDESVFGTSKERFYNTYAIKGGYMNYQVIGVRFIEDLTEKINSIGFVVTKDKAGKLPTKTTEIVNVYLKKDTRKMYETMAKKSVLQISGATVNAPIVLTQMLKLQQLTGGFINTEEGIKRVSQEKLDVCDELVRKYYEQGEKIVIFARFKEDLAMMYEKFTPFMRKEKSHVFKIEGGMNFVKLMTVQEAFTFYSKPCIMLCQIGAGSVGIDLTAASIGIFYSLDLVAENFIQSQDRIHRLNQARDVRYFYLLADKSIDHSIYNMLKYNVSIQNAILGIEDYKKFLSGGYIPMKGVKR